MMRMNRRRIIGFLLILLSVILFLFVGSQITKYVSLTGLRLGARADYTPPYPNHGLLVVSCGMLGIVLLLVGLYLASPRNK